MRTVLLLLTVLLSIQVHAGVPMRAETIGELPTSNVAYFYKPRNPYAQGTEFVVRRNKMAIAFRDGEPVYLKNRVCEMSAYSTLFGFRHEPANHLTKGQLYTLMSVRSDGFYDEQHEHARIRIYLGSRSANPRLLFVKCALGQSDSVESLQAGLEEIFEVREPNRAAMK